MAGGSLAFFAIFHVQHGLARTWTISRCITDPERLVHLANLVLALAMFLVLRREGLSKRTLGLVAAAALYIAAGTCLAVYGFGFEGGNRDTIAILAVFVIAWAIVIPSTAWRTFLLALPIPVVLLVIDLAYGTAYNYDGTEMIDPETGEIDRAFVRSAQVWNQTVLFFAIGVAAVASRVIYALRTKLEAAHRVGHYRLDEKIGQGGMGEVYRATHFMLRRPTAVKLLRPEITGKETILRFEQEVRLASRLTHPNTIRIFDYGRTPDGVFYYAMEFVRGLDLTQVVRRAGPLPACRAVHILEQACRALAEAHELGLVHRDVKPGNLMLCVKGGEHDVVKVLDFGLAKDLRDADVSLTQSGAVSGTVETLSPEVIEGEPPTFACDLYALGVVGCFLLTGKPIFDVQTPVEFVVRHLHHEPIRPSSRGVEVPGDLEDLLLRCLRKKPEERVESARALGAALRASEAYGAWTEEQAAAWWRAVGLPADEPHPDPRETAW
jgi:serine/threonine-protein kinase